MRATKTALRQPSGVRRTVMKSMRRSVNRSADKRHRERTSNVNRTVESNNELSDPPLTSQVTRRVTTGPREPSGWHACVTVTEERSQNPQNPGSRTLTPLVMGARGDLVGF